MSYLWIKKEEWDALRAELRLIHRLLLNLSRQAQQTEIALMATKATDQALIEEIHRNTDIELAAKAALEAQTAALTDLTQKLADAIANSDAADDPDVLAALATLKANNDDLSAATPVLAAAVANTNPDAPVPQV